MHTLNSVLAPGELRELPRSVFSTLSRLQPDALDSGLISVLERVVHAIGGDTGTLYEIKKLGESDILGHWSASPDRPFFDLQTCPWALGQVLSDEAVMFHVNDFPAIEALGLWREQAQ